MTKAGTVRAAGPWEHRDVHARGMSFHVVIAGDEPNRPTVILLHDFPLHWWSWRKQITALTSAGYRVIAVDLRGMGASDLQPGSVELLDLANDVSAIASATGTTSYSVVGSGVGGSVAWALAHQAPAALRSVVTICAPHPLTSRRRSSTRAIAAGRVDRELGVPFLRSRRLRDGSLVEAVLTTWAAPESHDHMSEVAAQYSIPLRRIFAANAALETQKAARKPSSATRKALTTAVGVPVWSIYGGRDGRVSKDAYSFDATHAKGPVTHVEIAESGHFPNEERPEEVTDILLSHLAQVYPDPAE